MCWELIIGIACLGVLFTNSKPTVSLREFIYMSIYKSNWDNKWHYKLISCTMCSTFHIYLWSVLIMTGGFDILGASISSVLGELICRKLQSGGLL